MLTPERTMQINTATEFIMGLLYICIPSLIIPGLTKAGLAMTRVLGTSLWGLAITSWQSSTNRTTTALAHLVMHAMAGAVLAFQVLATTTNENEDNHKVYGFKIPLAFHFCSTVLLLQSLITKTVKDAL
jgi:hypothetical protein